jgi:hypothetical protein
MCVADLLADARFSAVADGRRPVDSRSASFTPLLCGSRPLGTLVAVSPTPGIHQDVHLRRPAAVGRLIGPFVDMIVQLYRERRRRLTLLHRITQALGGTAPKGVPPDGGIAEGS